ncbi:Cupredoxin [Phascolomyces articulosus]|uniref:Cupredoxin n=1 Tax=Phascolomyces articulosus TaxID=60185 RepID=A0AAD5KQ16_9FUNG|nr:Cupredoxin [Phascolomyces articulosus]
MKSILSIAVPLVVASIAKAAIVEHWWDITYATANPDGLFERRVIGVNGTWPPPQVDVTVNDTLIIHTHNSLDQPTALHAHGMFQNGSVWADGPSMVTQCPIPPGHDLTYEFNITQHGSYWIHAHYMGQYLDGLRTPFILHNNPEAYTYDEEIVIPLADWYHEQSDVNLDAFLSQYNPTGAEPVPQSGLIMNTHDASFDFVPGKTYRLRLINMSGFSMFYVSIDGHDLDVIEVDGVDTERETVKSVYLTAAQRVSVLVTAKNTTDTNYYLRADMDTDMFDTLPEDLDYNLAAPVYYDRNHNNFAAADDEGMESTFDDITLKCLHPAAAVEPDHQVNLTIDFQVTTDGINRGMFNGLPYFAPKVPSLNTMLSMGNLSYEETVYGPQTQAFVLKHLDMVEIVLNNLDAGAHPFHLHGHVFQIVGRGPGVYDGNQSLVEQWYLDNPVQRDVVQVPAESFALIRFRADNPGAWFFHCHIEWHLESGLAAVMVEAPEIAQQRLKMPQEYNDICEAAGISSTGNAAGKEGLDLKGAPHGITLIYDGFTAKGKGAMAACIIAALIGMGSIVWYALADPEKKAREIRASKAQ